MVNPIPWQVAVLQPATPAETADLLEKFNAGKQENEMRSDQFKLVSIATYKRNVKYGRWIEIVPPSKDYLGNTTAAVQSANSVKTIPAGRVLHVSFTDLP